MKERREEEAIEREMRFPGSPYAMLERYKQPSGLFEDLLSRRLALGVGVHATLRWHFLETERRGNLESENMSRGRFGRRAGQGSG